MTPYAAGLLKQEARSLLTRLRRLQPFALVEPMVPAAALQPAARAAIEACLASGRRELHGQVSEFVDWLSRHGAQAPADEAQRRFSFLRLRFNAVLTQYDLFSDAVTQRSEHGNGVWLAGLDALADDAIGLPDRPPVVCYLDRGPGAAIRRARTRLPGGGDNPVAVIRVPRERMVGSGVASSLIHEAGHQGAAMLDLVNPLRAALQLRQRNDPARAREWHLWERWISEIVADFWSLLRVGIVATLGLLAVVSLPRVFVFRLNGDDPHPIPWIRVLLSCEMGRAVYPHPQWDRLEQAWLQFYPPTGMDEEDSAQINRLRASMPDFVAVLVRHRPALLGGPTLAQSLGMGERQPAQLLHTFRNWEKAPARMYQAPPTLAFAVLGQARSDGLLAPEEENILLARLLTHWALRGALGEPLHFPSRRMI